MATSPARVHSVDVHATPYSSTDLSDLLKPRASLYWLDMAGSSAMGWAFFALACTADNLGAMVAAGVVATALLYRAHLFIHELSHAARHIPLFSTVWNLTAGFPLLVPSSFAVGVHQFHHGRRTYGTGNDPEYLPFATSRWLILRFALLSVAFPWLMGLRFLVVGPLALLIPPLQAQLEQKATSLSMNPAFVRKVDRRTHRSILGQQVALLSFWTALVVLAYHRDLSLRTVWVWLAVATGVSLVNGARTLASHRYLGTTSAFDREGQKDDSIDTPGSWLTELWAPVGHRYHALHHHTPELPYHNLGIAYRRIHTSPPQTGAPDDSTSPGLFASLRQLWVAAGATARRPP